MNKKINKKTDNKCLGKITFKNGATISRRKIIKQLKNLCYNITVLENEKLNKYTTLKIGGKCMAFIDICTIEEIFKVVSFLSIYNIPYYILGRGSNLLIDDKGYDGVIIRIADKFSNIDLVEKNDEHVRLQVESGVAFNKLYNFLLPIFATCDIVDAIGLPGTIGGAIIMNASCYNYLTSNIVSSVLAIIDGKITELSNLECKFDYRSSIFNKINAIIIRVELKLKVDKNFNSTNRLNEIISKRQKQPKGFSAGCVFKNTGKISVGQYLDKLNLKGLSIGGAKISEQHANFIINFNNATSNDIIALMEIMLRQSELKLVSELKYLSNEGKTLNEIIENN